MKERYRLTIIQRQGSIILFAIGSKKGRHHARPGRRRILFHAGLCRQTVRTQEHRRRLLLLLPRLAEPIHRHRKAHLQALAQTPWRCRRNDPRGQCRCCASQEEDRDQRGRRNHRAPGAPVLLAQTWDGNLNPRDWWLSEKLDGVRAYWDGKQFLSRLGNIYHAPDWFLKGLPATPLDGELFLGRKSFQKTIAVVRRQDKSDAWKAIRYLIFDAPPDSPRSGRQIRRNGSNRSRPFPHSPMPYCIRTPPAPASRIWKTNSSASKLWRRGSHAPPA